MAIITNATLYLWIYAETKPANPNYELYKTVKQGEEVITFEIAELVKDYIEVAFTGDYIALNESSWVEWVMVQNFDDSSTNTVPGKVIAVNGYGYFKDGANPKLKKGALINNDIIYNYSGQNIYLPIYTGIDGAYKAEYYNGSTLLRTDIFGTPIISITADNTNITADSTDFTADMSLSTGVSSNVIIRVTPPINTTKILTTRNDNVVETINVETIEECKYTPNKISFLNQYGVVQDLWFFKRRNDSVNVSNDEYLENTLTSTLGAGVNYSINSATNIPTNFKSTKSIQLNTGYIDESHNEVIQELVLSERAWIHENNTVYPIKAKTKQLNYKTGLNDRLINFTIDFDYAFNEINLVK